MMKMKSWMTLCMFTLFAANAFAIENDGIRGEVVSFDTANRTMEVRITEVGSDVDARVGSTRSFVIPSDVRIEYEIDRQVYSPYTSYTLNEIRSGDRVLLDFDTTDSTRVVNLRNEQTTNVVIRDRIRNEGTLFDADDRLMASNDRTVDRSALPDSASSLPVFGLLGVLLAMLALGVRLGRQ
jgi:hypothetical protein